MSLDPDESYFWTKEDKKMGKCKPLFDIEIMPHVEKCRVDLCNPVRMAGVIAAQAYLDSKDKDVTHIKANVILPFSIILIMVGLLALIAWGMK
jgi:hypothetical protein